MANRRMFSLDVVDTDQFLEMPSSAQCLYFHLGMRADDDGFVSSPKKITRATNCSDDDLKLLKSEGYIIPFEKGVVVITHWKQNNRIQKDRYKPTIYQKEKKKLCEENSVYKMDTKCIQDVSKVEPQDSIGKDSIDKSSIDESSCDDEDYDDNFPYFIHLDDFYEQSRECFKDCLKEIYHTVPPDKRLLRAHCHCVGYVDADKFYDYYQAKGWMLGSRKINDWHAVLNNWIRRENGEIPEEDDTRFLIDEEIRYFRSDAIDRPEMYEGKNLLEAIKYWICERRYDSDSINAYDMIVRMFSLNFDSVTASINSLEEVLRKECKTEEELEEFEDESDAWREKYMKFMCQIKKAKSDNPDWLKEYEYYEKCIENKKDINLWDD